MNVKQQAALRRGLFELDRASFAVLIGAQSAFLIPILLEQYLLAVLLLAGLVAIALMFNSLQSGLVLLPFFIYTPIAIRPLFGIQLSELAVLLLFLSFVGTSLLSSSEFRFSVPAIGPVILILLAALFSMLNASYPKASIINILKYLEAFVFILYVTVNFVQTREWLIRILSAVVLAGFSAAVLGLVRFSSGLEFRIFGLLGGGFGAFVGISVVCALSMVLFLRPRWTKWVYLGVLPPMIVALLLSQSRAWIASTLIATLFLLFWFVRAKKRVMPVVILTLILAFALTWFFSTGFLGSTSRSDLERAVGKSLQTGLSKSDDVLKYVSFLMRLSLWSRGFDLYLDHPVLGFGIGNLRFRNMMTGELGDPGDPDVGYVDNHYLNVLYETGVLGAIGWLWLMVVIYRRLTVSLQLSSEPEWRAVLLAIAGSLIILFLGGFFWVLTVVHEMTVMVAFLLGLALAADHIVQTESGSVVESLDAPARC